MGKLQCASFCQASVAHVSFGNAQIKGDKTDSTFNGRTCKIKLQGHGFRERKSLWSFLEFIYILISHKNRSEKQCGSISNSTDFEGRQRVWIYHFLTVWPWLSYLTLLSLSILIHKMGIIMSTSQGHVDLKKCTTWKLRSLFYLADFLKTSSPGGNLSELFRGTVWKW